LRAAANEKAPASNFLYSRYLAAKYTVGNPRPTILVISKHQTSSPPCLTYGNDHSSRRGNEDTGTVMAINPDPLAHYDIR
jgi:hypothetical protein